MFSHAAQIQALLARERSGDGDLARPDREAGAALDRPSGAGTPSPATRRGGQARAAGRGSARPSATT